MSGPKRDVDEHCDILWKWLDLIEDRVRRDGAKADPNLKDIAEHAGKLRTAIMKSSYLGRRLYGEEEHRTVMCPEHRGRWSGLPSSPGACRFGCELTGWLPVGAMPDDIHTAMLGIVKEWAVADWWHGPIPSWGGKTPKDMWEDNPDKVYDLVESYYDPSYS